jgi:hypothetical protein
MHPFSNLTLSRQLQNEIMGRGYRTDELFGQHTSAHDTLAASLPTMRQHSGAYQPIGKKETRIARIPSWQQAKSALWISL